VQHLTIFASHSLIRQQILKNKNKTLLYFLSYDVWCKQYMIKV